jgi:hypothetical protein
MKATMAGLGPRGVRGPGRVVHLPQRPEQANRMSSIAPTVPFLERHVGKDHWPSNILGLAANG